MLLTILGSRISLSAGIYQQCDSNFTKVCGLRLPSTLVISHAVLNPLEVLGIITGSDNGYLHEICSASTYKQLKQIHCHDTAAWSHDAGIYMPIKDVILVACAVSRFLPTSDLYTVILFLEKFNIRE